jgi:hypothetical protein
MTIYCRFQGNTASSNFCRRQQHQQNIAKNAKDGQLYPVLLWLKGKGQTKLRYCLFNDINLKEKMTLPKGKLWVTCGIESGMGRKVVNIFAK